VGQDEAVEKVAQFVKRALVGLRNTEKPIGSLMFIGQTGVGKTELAKALSAEIMEEERDLIRIDCSEYSQAHEYAKLLGAPPGYIGYDEGGMLSQLMARRGMQVVLFDEIEKAHPRLHNLLLQILDEGAVHDSHGKRIDFNNAIIILTSNVGSVELERQNRPLGFVSEDATAHYKNLKQVALRALERHFPPEFLNRLDEVVVFHELSKENLLRIVDILLADVLKRLQNMGLFLEIGREVKEFLVEKGYSPRYGARPLKRTIKQYVEVSLSEGMLRGAFRQGRLRAVVQNDAIVFESLS
jgi:ATP-dependent Clp protease ATP-binding subunit ClpC